MGQKLSFEFSKNNDPASPNSGDELSAEKMRLGGVGAAFFVSVAEQSGSCLKMMLSNSTGPPADSQVTQFVSSQPFASV